MKLDFIRLILYIFLGEWELAVDLSVRAGDNCWKVSPGSHHGIFEALMRGPALLAATKMTKRRRYAGGGRKVLKMSDNWIRKGNKDIHHYNVFLEAEFAALKGNRDVAESCMKKQQQQEYV